MKLGARLYCLVMMLNYLYKVHIYSREWPVDTDNTFDQYF